MKKPIIAIIGLSVVLPTLVGFFWMRVTSRGIAARSGVDALVYAIEAGDDAQAGVLIRRGLGNELCYPACHDSDEWCRPIHVAARKGRFRILALLLAQKGIEPDARDYRGETPLMQVCNYFEISRAVNYWKSLDELIRHGADPNEKSHDGRSALHFTSHPPFLPEALIAAGADPNRQDSRGNTPLHECCSGDRVGPDGSSADGIATLLLAGADPSILNKQGLTPKQLAVRKKRQDIVRIFERYERFGRDRKQSD